MSDPTSAAPTPNERSDAGARPARSEQSGPATATPAGATQAGASEIAALSDGFVTDLCQASPISAIYFGRSAPGDGRLDDLSPEGLERLRDLVAGTVDRIRSAESTGRDDDIAREVILERLSLELDKFETGWMHAQLNVIASPLQEVRMAFDVMPSATHDDWELIAQRMHAVPGAVAGYRQSLGYAADRGRVAAVRQIDKCAEQCATYAGTPAEPGFFSRMAAGAGKDGTLGAALAGGAAAADAAYGELGRYLATELRGRAPEKDSVGEERYALASRDFLGDAVDLVETYQWGWQEFLSIEAELLQVAGRIAPGEKPAAAAAKLDQDPEYQVRGQDGLQAWMQGLSDRAVAELGSSHFDIPEPIRHLECRIAPPGGGVGAYYTGPSDDFSRPGRMWWSVEQGREDFSTWRETTVVYHEGVPGHHLQIGTATYQREHLNDFQRLMANTSGYAEGWALYAERLVRELGYLDSDGVLLGMLDSQLFRAARVVVDIGMHLELQIPTGTGFHEGERWTPELGLEFLLTRTISDPAHCRDEIDRYLGWPGQAPSYKVGERVWLAGREASRQRLGDEFDLKVFHTAALSMGGMGLGPLARRLATL